jgi:EAL domain-containing protein (putative c-di-GMP-specific phosphodiesterase class I)
MSDTAQHNPPSLCSSLEDSVSSSRTLPPPLSSERFAAPVFKPAPTHQATTSFVLQPVFRTSGNHRDVAYYEVLARGPFVASMLEHLHLDLLELSCCFAARAMRVLRTPTLVNVEPRSLNEDPARAARAVIAAGCHVEVTERGLLTPGALDALHTVQEAGVEVWLDDFGTEDSTTTGRRGVLEAGLVTGVKMHISEDLAAPERLLVIIEGVETPQQLAAAHGRGSGFAQGYLLGRPAPLETFST